MTLIYNDASITGPGTHILVIGVGEYPHLPGGKAATTPHDDGMRQLSSPPVSARHMCDWIVEYFHNPDKPLASVDFLLSEKNVQAPGTTPPYTPPARTISGPQTAPQAYSVDLAEVQTIAAAAAAWKQRGDDVPGSLLIFYFCGHGISAGTDYALVARDYGANPPGKPFHGLIDFTEFLVGMSDCKSVQQVYFVDACRSTSEALITARNYKGDELVQAAGDATKGLQQCVYYSTLGGQPAHARPNEPSLFTDALVKSFRGPGAANSNGSWRINTIRLIEAIAHFMDALLDPSTPSVQVPQSGGQTRYDLHHLSGNPKVPINVPIGGHQGPTPPTSPPINFQSLSVNAAGTLMACYPPPAPAQGELFEWEKRHFVSWLDTGSYEVEVKTAAGTKTLTCDLMTPGQTVIGF